MRFVPAIVLAAHGIAHLARLALFWQIGSLAELLHGPAILAGPIDADDGGLRAMALLWMVSGLGLLAASVGLAAVPPRSLRVTVLVVLSLGLCATEWPDARMGLFVDLVLAAAFVINARWVVRRAAIAVPDFPRSSS